MAEKTMKVQFKTKTKGKGVTEPAGKVHTLPEAKAQEYIRRGLAVEVKQTAEELAKAETDAKAKAEAEAKAKAEADAKAKADAEADAKKTTLPPTSAK